MSHNNRSLHMSLPCPLEAQVTRSRGLLGVGGWTHKCHVSLQVRMHMTARTAPTPHAETPTATAAVRRGLHEVAL